ncbi:MAG TPA: class I SAM-dependent methyltransferase [Dongiaceae bacterium]|jgi:SAM-dependent methyltransferase|nr:class I SAM-dependent methyltransferase [Dongiaceae bacterium]
MADPVRQQYELLPYPARDPREEAQHLIEGSPSHLLELNHYIFGGVRDFSALFRALVAGGGTGDALIMLAQHLANRNCPAEIIYLDLSTASRAIAEERAKVRGLGNIKFMTGSLLDLLALDLGKFDYIDCCGVLHHLADPGAGLAALTSVLAPDGGLGVMVYGALGRTGVYPMQAMLKTLASYAPAPALTPTAQLAAARDLLKQLPATNWLRRNPAIGDHLAGGDAGLHDLLLHAQDRAYSVAELAELAKDAGLEIAAFIEPWRYDPASYLTDPGLLHRLERLDPIARAAFAEQLAGNLKRHIVYLVREGRARTSVARPDDKALVPVLRAGSEDLANALRGRNNLKVAIDGLELRFKIPPHASDILAVIDGKRSIADIHQQLSGRIDALKDWSAFKPAFDRVYHTFNRLNRLFLARSDV